MRLKINGPKDFDKFAAMKYAKKWHCLLSDDTTGAVPPKKKRKCTFEDEDDAADKEENEEAIEEYKKYLKDSTLF